MLKLLIDIGNSYTKLAVFNDNQKVYFTQSTSFAKKDLIDIKASFPEISAAIFSSSAGIPEFLPIFLSREISFSIELNHTLPLPIQIDYKTPATLGKDRIAVVVGAQQLFPESNVLVIDIGTAITYELLTAEGIYKGGNISPGMELRFRALNVFTEELPLLSSKSKHPFIGDNTENAIISGVQSGIVFEIDGYIDELKRKYKGLKTVLSGGNSFFFAKKLKNSTFAESDLLFYGLNKILEYNILKNTNE
ncbi:MAG: type III pantothenate kinase [Bacteroidota bacterium]|nr:type III pantothenate kinase [Bacteroidota bacterium]